MSLPGMDPGELRGWWGSLWGQTPGHWYGEAGAGSATGSRSSLLRAVGQQKWGPLGLEKGSPSPCPFPRPHAGLLQPQHPGKVQPHRAQLCSVQGPRTLVISPWRSLLPLGRVSTTPSLAPAGPGFLSPHSLFPSSPLPLCNSCQTHHTPQLCCPAEASGGAGDLGTHLPFLPTAPAAFPPLIVLGVLQAGGVHTAPHTLLCSHRY